MQYLNFFVNYTLQDLYYYGLVLHNELYLTLRYHPSLKITCFSIAHCAVEVRNVCLSH